jgi:hypothetical protein
MWHYKSVPLPEGKLLKKEIIYLKLKVLVNNKLSVKQMPLCCKQA